MRTGVAVQNGGKGKIGKGRGGEGPFLSRNYILSKPSG